MAECYTGVQQRIKINPNAELVPCSNHSQNLVCVHAPSVEVNSVTDQYQSEDSVSRRPVPGRPRATTPAEDRFLALSARRRRTTTVPQLVADHFQASGRRISATTVRNRLHNAGLYARRPVVCVPSTDDSEGTAYAGQENMFLGQTMGFCAVHRRVQIYNGE
ncbi:HTH_Tnp_Tc3_2 domain-containing protein [Trichonephila clavipes]|nr:HTH_Tnp_Tc3_2 domain-containing protein [Trichonephila clavipes]